MLFSEPKIPQLGGDQRYCRGVVEVSVLFSEPKIPQLYVSPTAALSLSNVSVLFSEPKIPQLSMTITRKNRFNLFQCSSASRKFLNETCKFSTGLTSSFQCSSASRKFLNLAESTVLRSPPNRFSALQRAENSSISPSAPDRESRKSFQCSSASRKFLNCQ